MDVSTGLLLNFNPLLQLGSRQEGQDPGPRAAHPTVEPVSAPCSDLQAGEGCQPPAGWVRCIGKRGLPGEGNVVQRERGLRQGPPGLRRELQHCLGWPHILPTHPVCPVF